MSLSLNPGCLKCFLSNQIDLASRLGTQEQALIFARRLMACILQAPEDTPTPCFGPQVSQLLHEICGAPLDRFRQEKIDSNQFVLERLPQIREKALSARDPVKAGLQLAILGNYIDFVALRGKVDFQKLDSLLAQALEIPLQEEVYASFLADLSQARTLLYLTDNAGEIGFDRIFAEVLAAHYPNLAITFCVRGGIANNDATREDAAAVGIPFPVIDSGSSIAGMYLPQCSEESRRAVEEADLVLAKGMANTETMWGCGHRVYYAFLVKCQRFAELFDSPMFSPVFVKEP